MSVFAVTTGLTAVAAVFAVAVTDVFLVLISIVLSGTILFLAWD